ncbi:TetR/AcrR family transcriptional regulator [Sediminibacillus halophilus]|uniref:DNA-binding transcriptional regulator, AcrR family n=1 Tax=Sediminibacillus halophilus TaxID=482461 RepID=A0A1G9TQU9_9BACI|nr:TetR/AcrR family transcriptional regulator [Sediminibacillus halophilus]SDM50032.1 DNA-binding transcriptional regulator, AcrR family [Sediminibacillus halophilus]
MHENESFQKLINVTEKIISEKGCQKTTLNEIIQRSGLSKGAIYHYVKSKNELFVLVLKHQLEQVDKQFQSSMKEQKEMELGEPLRQTLKSFIHSKRSVSNQIFFYLVSHQNKPEDQEILEEFQNAFFQHSVKWIKAGQNGGPIPDILDAEKISAFFTILGYGMRVQAMISESEELLAQEDVFQLMRATLSNTPISFTDESGLGQES